jgi:hypothetical protein
MSCGQGFLSSTILSKPYFHPTPICQKLAITIYAELIQENSIRSSHTSRNIQTAGKYFSGPVQVLVYREGARRMLPFMPFVGSNERPLWVQNKY